jgi:hypothetical protein
MTTTDSPDTPIVPPPPAPPRTGRPRNVPAESSTPVETPADTTAAETAADGQRTDFQVPMVVSVVRSYLPPPERLLFFTGLAVLAALEILEWPVAAAVATATVVAARSREGRSSVSPA